ncbi:MFS transporter [Rhodopila sp.]|jgi:MFS family permease|uniref:MFS transporter n=1 Tax=Rhodopila sp. TaxID=2480087 RepID=UPI002B5CFD00|nr:MFS transporter [Rhodopila sp.]HVZ07161.1 MFS transporter [Rhodopila sp.]
MRPDTMGPGTIARLVGRRLHYAWVVVGIMFVVILASVGVRAAPGVLIVPLQDAFGWTNTAISGAISLNILLFGLVGPFAAGFIQTIGLKRTILASMTLLVLGAGLSGFITEIWQLYLTWGVLVGLGSGAGMVGLATAIANRWFTARRGLVVGLLTASNASGQLVFLPLLASLATHQGWHAVPLVVAAVILALMPVVMLFLPESPAAIGLPAYGATEVAPLPVPGGNPFLIAFEGLARGLRSIDFWLLLITFSICGFSTNGLVGTHLIPYCIDHGIPEVSAAGLLAAMGIFDLVGTTLSGYLTDRFNPRILLFWYYGLRGLSLAVLPFTDFDVVSLGIFAIFYGLDWVATVPPTVTLTNEVFGRKDAPVMISWIVAGHAAGGAIAALGAGTVRYETGSYVMAFVASGVACLLAALLVLRIARHRGPALMVAE